jgi:2-polyprenyl-6-methoxyphenol hydroxylase-like FAD-dependent oxidoreductase
MAGLIAARVLSAHVDQVTLIERDEAATTSGADMAQPRRGAPQGQHLHVLLARGGVILNGYFPGLTDELIAAGAVAGDPGRKLKWHVDGGYRCAFDYGHNTLLLSRPLIEGAVRARVRALPNVRVLHGQATALLAQGDNARVTGVTLERRDGGATEQLTASLVVDCSGRASAMSRWLAALGYAAPEEDTVKIDVAYATRLYRRRRDQSDNALYLTPTAPHQTRGAGMFPIEPDSTGERWILTQVGLHGDHPPTDERAFNAFARSLPAPDIANLLDDSEPLSGISTFKYPASLRRRYERLQRHPEGVLVLGDAFVSFNPIYGQGMTSAALQADVLNTLLTQSRSLDGLWRRYYRAASAIVDACWQLSVGADFAYPQTRGARPAGIGLINRYMAALHRATHSDPVVHARFLECINLMRPLASLFSPDTVLRVWRAAHRRPAQDTTRAASAAVPSAQATA